MDELVLLKELIAIGLAGVFYFQGCLRHRAL